MSAKHTNPVIRTVEKPGKVRVSWKKLRSMTEEEIMRTSPPELADLPDDFFDEADLVFPSGKRMISIRIDEDVLEWFKGASPRYQTHINAVLRTYMKRAPKPKAPAKARRGGR